MPELRYLLITLQKHYLKGFFWDIIRVVGSQIENETHEIIIRNGPHMCEEFKIRNSFENHVIAV